MNKKVAIDLNIRAAFYNVSDPTEIYVVWKRGVKSIDTSIKDIDGQRPTALFNEKFQMQTSIEYYNPNRMFLPKKCELELRLKKEKKLIGRTDFDLAFYANKNGTPSNDRLLLRD